MGADISSVIYVCVGIGILCLLLYFFYTRRKEGFTIPLFSTTNQEFTPKRVFPKPPRPTNWFKPFEVFGKASKYTRTFDPTIPSPTGREGFAVYTRSGLKGNTYGNPTFPPISTQAIGVKNSNLNAAMYSSVKDRKSVV